MRSDPQAISGAGCYSSRSALPSCVLAQNYRIGTAARMGPGYFPTMLGGLLALLGVSLSVPAFVTGGDGVQRFHLRPLLFVLLGVAAFGVTLP